MSKTRVWIAVVACFVLCFANLLYAESAPSTSNTAAMVDVLKTLESKGVITHQEFETLNQKVTAEAANPQLRTIAMQDEEGKAMNVVSAMDSGVGFHAGRFDVAFSGEVNGFYVHTRAETNPARQPGGILSLVSQGALPSSSIRSGLLPSDLSIKISTQEHGWDVAVFFGIWPAIQNNLLNGNVESAVGGIAPGTTALGTPGIDFRQNFATLGRPGFGTLKVGRDLGLFGQEAILNDMTLLGAGTPNDQGGGNQFPGNVTLGRIGVGYVYTDFIPQITYTTPSFKGLQAAFSVMQAYDDTVTQIEQSPLVGIAPANFTFLNAHGQPQFQAKLTYTAPTHGPVKAKFWSNMVTEAEEAPLGATVANNGIAAGDNLRVWGVDYGTKLDFHGLSLVGYGYNGWGLGLGGLFLDGIGSNAAGIPIARPSQGWYAQLNYTIHKNTFGFSYGQSNLSPDSAADFASGNSGIVRNNTSYVAQYRLAVTKWDNLVAEYIHDTSEDQAFTKGNSDSIALGTIVFF